MAIYLHDSSYIDDGAVVGDDTRIWHFCHIHKKAVIGKACVLGQNVYVGAAVLGDNVRVQNNVSIYDGVTLEDHVFCGPSAVFTNVVNPRSEVSRKDEYKPTLVKRGATIGANATIICGAVIGEYAFIGAGAVVREDVLPYALMLGVPARRVGWMCRCGVRLSTSPRSYDTQHGYLHCTACSAEYAVAKDARGAITAVDA